MFGDGNRGKSIFIAKKVIQKGCAGINENDSVNFQHE